MRTILCAAAIAALTLAQPVTAEAAPESPSATALLFDAPHLSTAAKGTTLAYKLKREVSDPKLLGEPFEDDIKVDITDEGAAGTRTVVVKVFTGERGRPDQNIEGMTGNPVLVVFLDRAVNNLSMLAGGNRPYLKNKIKTSFLNAKVTPVEIAYKGATVKGNRVRVQPFSGDPNALKMMGYDGVTFEIVVSDAVPGHFVALTSHYESPMKGAPKLDEVIAVDGAGEIK